MSGYVYRGAGKDTRTPPELQALLDLEPDLPDQPAWPCGTHTGAKRHERAGEPPCEPCRDARNERQRTRSRNPHVHSYRREVVVTVVRECECGDRYEEEAG